MKKHTEDMIVNRLQTGEDTVLDINVDSGWTIKDVSFPSGYPKERIDRIHVTFVRKGTDPVEKLKSCPFCGRKPNLVECGSNQWFVQCGCGIEGKLYFQKCDAIKSWNRRKKDEDQNY